MKDRQRINLVINKRLGVIKQFVAVNSIDKSRHDREVVRERLIERTLSQLEDEAQRKEGGGEEGGQER